VGAATNGSAFAYWTNTIKVYATGADIFGTADAFSFVWREMAGDFDVSVDLNYLLETDAAAKAGLMARDMTDATYPAMQEREITIASFPGQGIGRNQNLFQYREEFGTNTLAPAAPRPASTFPDNWLRLKRKGSVFWGMVSSNNWDWVAVNAVDTATNSAGAYPPTLRVGLAVTSHNVALTTESFWSSYGLPNERPTLNMAWSTNAPGVLDFSWPSWIVGSYKLQVTPSLSPPAIWSDVSGSQTTNFLSLAVGPGNLFFRLSP
jgi:hypothetical protein